MGALGVFAFAGLMAVAPDMINSLDRYLDDKNVYDIKIISDMGLDPDDVSAIELLPAIEKAEGVKYRDAEVKLGEEEALVNISSLPDGLNEIDLTSGRLPEAKNEIAVEEALLEVNDLEPGDSIYIDDEEGFYEKEVFITGVVKSPLFYNSVEVDNDRGITNIGAGTLKFYAYAPESNFKADYLSIIYATVVGAKEQTTGSEKYLELIDDADSQLEEIRTACQDSRYKTIMGTAEDKINEESKDAKAQLEDAARQLADAKSTLEDALSQIEEKEGLLKDLEEPVDLKIIPLRHHKQRLVECRELSLKYKKSAGYVFENLTFEVAQGERIFISGENGSGKSSLINAILEKVNHAGQSEFETAGELNVASGIVVSYICQDTSHLKGSLREHAVQNGLNYTLFLSLLRQLDLERAQFDKNIEEFSDGQKKKVLIASSLLTPAHLYIWDEPLNYIDVFSRMQIEALIEQYKPTMLIVEHDVRFREKLAMKEVRLQ